MATTEYSSHQAISSNEEKKMKIYFVVSEPTERTINHFVTSLGNTLQKQGCEVLYGRERLWTDEVFSCDIIHFQWPEYVLGSPKQKLSNEDLERLEQRLKLLKNKGIKIFQQVHNLKPHTNDDRKMQQLYELFYQYADVIVHMGSFSRDILQPKYPKAQHVILPHHIYDDVYTFSESQDDARKKLKLQKNQKIVLSFGKFRNQQERNFVLNLQKKLGNSVTFLMPGFYRNTLRTLNPKKICTRLFNTLRYKLKGIKFSNDTIPDDLMQSYFCAADVILIQRLNILNSGNLPMAFATGKTVVGPDIGNVGQILHETGNYVFDPQNQDSAIEAIQRALNDTVKGSENKNYAIEHWSSNVIAAKLLKCYQQTKGKDNEIN